MRRLLAIPLVLLLMTAGAMVWSGSAAGQRADFTFINRGENKCLDPNCMSWMQDIRIAYALWEGLYALDSKTLSPVPGTADRIEISPDKTVFTFHIRDDARWSNGDPVRAADFLFAWRRMLETPGEYTYLHFYIKGAEAYEEAYAARIDAVGKGQPAPPAPDFSAVGEKVVDPQTFIVTLEHPVIFFPALCAFPPFFPMHEPSMRPFATVDHATGQTTYSQDFTRPPNLVSNGPYRLAEWSFKRRLRMIGNDFYWDRANVRSKVIDQLYGDEPVSAFREYESGAVDWLSDVDPSLSGDMVKQGGRPDLHIFPGFGTYFYEFNVDPKLPDGRPNPLADVRVRQALALSIDRLPIVRDICRIGNPQAFTYIPQGIFPDYPSPAGLGPMDVARAQRLLAEAGYPNGRGFPNLSILFNTEGTHGDIAQMIRRQWQTNLGITMDLEGVEIKVFGARKHGHEFEVGRASWIGDYADPSTFTDKYKSDSDDNDADWKSPDYDKYCADAALEADPAKRMALLSKAEQILLTEAPIVPIYNYVNAYMFRTNVEGISLDPRETVIFQSIEVKRDR
jgi:oligopeptide transport system substrate-binding protein